MRVRILFPALSVAAALMLVVTGCNRESPKGGPGADKTKGNPPVGTNERADSFSVKVPSGHTNVTQGSTTDVTISVSRGGNFAQDVKITVQAPEGVQVVPDSWTAKKDADEAKFTIKAADTAAPGKNNVRVTGTPATGSATTVDMGIEIKKK